MLVSFQGHFKYPVRYVWIDKVNADDLNCLLSRILDLCAGNNINVQCITMGGTAVNFISIKLFGGKLGHSLAKNNGDFTDDSYNYNSGSIAHSKISSPCTWWTRNFSRQQMSENRMEIYHLTTWRTNAIRSKIWKYSFCQTHIPYFRNKMNVKVPARNIADARLFIIYSGHRFFQHAEATVHFMRTIDRLFNILNVKNLYGKGFKQPLISCNQIIWGQPKVNLIEYLLTLKTIGGTPLIIQHRKIFPVGFITANSSTKMLALDLMENNDFQSYLVL